MRKEKCEWDVRHAFKAAVLAYQGMKDKHIAQMIGCTGFTFQQWMKKKPVFREAVEFGRQAKIAAGQTTLRDFVYQRLAPELKAIWDEIDAVGESGNAVAQIEGILADRGRKVRQHLFLYALTVKNFDPSAACRQLCIPMTEFYNWKNKDPEFGPLFQEILEHKKNFIESCLMGLVASGDTQAVIFANRTLNKDRGYGESIELKGNIQHNHVHTFALTEQLLETLSLRTRRELLSLIEEERKIIEHRTLQPAG